MSWFSRFRNVFREEQIHGEIDEELRFHLEQRAKQLVRDGMERPEAERFARVRLGGARAREESRDVKILTGLESVFQDIRFGIRVLWKDRGAIGAAVFSLALALGACSTAFSLLDALIFRTLPVQDPDRLYSLSYADERTPTREHDGFSYPMLTHFREAVAGRMDLFGANLSAGFQTVEFEGGLSERVRVDGFSGDAFSVLGLAASGGRLIEAGDDTPSGPRVAVLSHAFWTSRFAGDPAIIGRLLTLGDHRHQIIGVAAREFSGLAPGYRTDVWIPLTQMVDARVLANAKATWVNVWGRIRRDTGPRPVEQALRAAFLSPRTPLVLRPAASGADSLFRKQFGRPLRVFGIFSMSLLLIAATNVANLFLARAAAREQEMALRVALGARRMRLVRQLLVEAALVSLAACCPGIILGQIAAPFLTARLGVSQFPAWLHVGLDWKLLTFLMAAAASVTLLFGIAPALRASSVNPEGTIKSGARQSSGTGVLRPLVPIQVAFSTIVLFLAGLLLVSFEKLTHLDPGFRADHLILFTIDAKGLNPERSRLLETEVLSRLAGAGGVGSVSASQQALIGGAFAFVMTPPIRLPGRDTESERPLHVPVSPLYFANMKTPLLAGREFDAQDIDTVIVNQAFAERYFPGQPALGQRFEELTDAGPEAKQVVGVAANSLFNNLRESVRPIMYSPLRTLNGAALEVRTLPEPGALTATLRREIESVDPALHVRNATLQTTRIADTLVSERLLAWMGGFFAIAAIILVAVGLHGVISYFVARRRREIGIRMALGAAPNSVLRLVVSHVALLLLAGILAGVLAGQGLARYVQTLLFDVKPAEAWSVAAPVLCVLATATLAALRPALSATRVDPATTLRCE